MLRVLLHEAATLAALGLFIATLNVWAGVFAWVLR